MNTMGITGETTENNERCGEDRDNNENSQDEDGKSVKKRKEETKGEILYNHQYHFQLGMRNISSS